MNLYPMNCNTESLESHRSSHVLLVDDDDFMLEMVEDMLHDLGVTSVTKAADGKRAFAAFEVARQRLDIIICDINMPDVDGFQLMEMLAKKHPHCGIILMSGLEKRFIDSAVLMAKFHQLNFLGALQKPVSKQALTELIAKRQTLRS